MGRPMLVLLSLMGLKRTMRMNFRSANSYAETKLAEVSPTEFQGQRAG